MFGWLKARCEFSNSLYMKCRIPYPAGRLTLQAAFPIEGCVGYRYPACRCAVEAT